MTEYNFNSVSKDRLFYNRYNYCLGFYLQEISSLRQVNHDYIDDTMARRKQWREMAQQRWHHGRQKHGIILSRSWKEITEKTVADLHALAEQLIQSQADYKLVVSINQGYVYTNDFNLIDRLSSMPQLAYKTYTKAIITRPKNTVALKNPKYKFRSYFKMKSITAKQKDHLMDFLHGQQHISISPGLQRWFDFPFNRIQDYFFIDHDNESWLTMLNLVIPGCIRKTMHIIPAK